MRTVSRAASSGLSLIVLLALAACARGLGGQSTVLPSEASIAAVDRFWPEVTLNVLVLDKSGAPQKIDEQAFQLFEDRAERPLHFPVSASSPVSLALLIDTSGSTYKRKPEIASAITAILHALPPDSEVMAVDFSSVAFLDLPFTPVSKADFSFLERVPAAGPTALYDAVASTEDYFIANAKYSQRAMVILSDGENNASEAQSRIAYGMMERPGAPMVYTCLIARTRFLQPETGYGRNNMTLLAKRGGGLTFNLDPDPAAAAAQIVATIRSQHVLQFTAADPAHNGKEHKLKIQSSDKDAQVYGLPAYFAPAK